MVCSDLLFTGFLVSMFVCPSHCQRNVQCLAADISYTGCQNWTKFGTLIDRAYIISKIGELWSKGSPWAPRSSSG